MFFTSPTDIIVMCGKQVDIPKLQVHHYVASNTFILYSYMKLWIPRAYELVVAKIGQKGIMYQASHHVATPAAPLTRARQESMCLAK